MRFLMLHAYYPEFLIEFNGAFSHLNTDYQKRLRKLLNQSFGLSDYYSESLKSLGHQAWDLVFNDSVGQSLWCQKNKRFLWGLKHLSRVPYNEKIFGVFGLQPVSEYWFEWVLESQIAQFEPNVILVISMPKIRNAFLARVKKKYQSIELIVGQHASPISDKLNDLSAYDLIVSSLPNQVEEFGKKGVKTKFWGLGFGEQVLDRVKISREKKYQVAHIGGIDPVHQERMEFLDQLSRQVKIDFWGYGLENTPTDSPIRESFHGEAWGKQMYQIRSEAKICLNKHIRSFGAGFANNMTLFETTGVGTMLLTDNLKKIKDYFIPGKEVVVYRDVEDCVKKIEYYLKHDKEREKIAKAGQKRTLKDHVYSKRISKLLRIIKDEQNN